MKVLVTGGAGFIGSHLVEALVARGDAVVVLDDLSTGKRANLAAVAEKVDLQVGSVADRAAVDRAIAGCEVAFHQAAIASVPKTIEAPVETNAVNFGGTLNVLEAARAAGTRRVIFASSAAVYGDEAPLPVAEDAPVAPLSPYAIEKLCAEHYVRVWAPLFGLETVALRYFNVFGPRQDPKSPYSGVVSIFVDRILKGEAPTIFGDGEQTRDFVAVADVVRANLAAATVDRPEGLVCNVARGEATSLNQLYATLADLAGGAPDALYGPARAGDVRHSRAVVDRARDALGFVAKTPVRDGLAALLDWARSTAG
ncbi:MAG: SDR family oxidoreductase [Myxococcales bacterium]|nr:SDR family oxidoreductase [Myxococcales bacterium]MCB9540281.1 SDR family oxidoreductase [Myxococcales bacterium]